jgi:hypothetical protein
MVTHPHAAQADCRYCQTILSKFALLHFGSFFINWRGHDDVQRLAGNCVFIPRVASFIYGPEIQIALKFGRKQGLDFGQGIEPGDQRAAYFAVFEAAVQLLQDGLGEATDFAITGQVHNFYGRIYPDLPGFTRINCFHLGSFFHPTGVQTQGIGPNSLVKSNFTFGFVW